MQFQSRKAYNYHKLSLVIQRRGNSLPFSAFKVTILSLYKLLQLKLFIQGPLQTVQYFLSLM